VLLPTPAVVCSLPVVVKDHSPTDLVVRLLGWVPGRPMSTFPMLPLEALADAGRFLGRLSLCLSSLPTDELAAARRYHQWDGKNTADLKDFVQYVTDERKRSMVVSVVETFQTELIDSGVAEESFPKSLIHGDFNDANFLLNDDFCVTGVIDFGDSVERYVAPSFLLTSSAPVGCYVVAPCS
jgi:Ser/Thr protein kinase RdoA (MazF antagonist)